SGIVLLALHPLHLFDPGFQLSFAATFGILSCGRFRDAPFRRSGRLRESQRLSAGAWLATFPLLACNFFQVSFLALPLNLLAAPFLSGALLGGALLLLAPCRWIGEVLQHALALFSGICHEALR